MPTPEIEEFAKLIVRRVRDEAIASCDRLLSPIAKAPIARRWQQAGDVGAITVVIPDAIDEAAGANHGPAVTKRSWIRRRSSDRGDIQLRLANEDGVVSSQDLVR
jgi:hypothetical protein